MVIVENSKTLIFDNLAEANAYPRYIFSNEVAVILGDTTRYKRGTGMENPNDGYPMNVTYATKFVDLPWTETGDGVVGADWNTLINKPAVIAAGATAAAAKTVIALQNVDNTTDVGKPLSTAQKAYVDGALSPAQRTAINALVAATSTTQDIINALKA